MEGCALDTVHDDALLAICRWLTGSDLARLAQTCRKVRKKSMHVFATQSEFIVFLNMHL